jgi:hypothetical protein
VEEPDRPATPARPPTATNPPTKNTSPENAHRRIEDELAATGADQWNDFVLGGSLIRFIAQLIAVIFTLFLLRRTFGVLDAILIPSALLTLVIAGRILEPLAP